MWTVGDRLKQARRRARLTQTGLASASGVGLATIRRVEQTGATPRVATAWKLADALGVDPKWLVFGDDEPREKGT